MGRPIYDSADLILPVRSHKALRKPGRTIYGLRISNKAASILHVPTAPAPSDLHARIVSLLTQARKDAKLRQVDLARKLGWQQAYVSRYETGERMLGVDEFVAVALAIGTDPVALLNEALQPPSSSLETKKGISRVRGFK